jgi:hypothetical protein
MGSYLGHVDGYLPVIGVPSAQQYDNYGIYDIVCVDILLHKYLTNVIVSTTTTAQSSWLAIQAYSVESIPMNFQTIINMYN